MLTTRLAQGTRTSKYPEAAADLPERFRGRPALDPTRCPEGCRACVDACPTEAIAAGAEAAGGAAGAAAAGLLAVDLGRCLFCRECTVACPEGAIRYTPDHRLAARRREDLVIAGAETPAQAEARLAGALEGEMRRLFGRSLKLRQVSAAGCTGCETELAALGNVVFDLGRFGVQFVASPRHADGVLVTGPVSENMRAALRSTWEAVPSPRLVIAVGACAISGGPFRGNPEVHDGAAGTVPVDLFIPGCPPHPFTVLDGLLRLLGRLPRAIPGKA